MVKNLADELTDILNWIENPGLGEHAHDEAKAGLICFCRGLVCGLRSGEQANGDTQLAMQDELLDAFKPDWDNAEAKLRENLCRKRQENAQMRPVDEANKDPRFKEPLRSDVCLGSESVRVRS
jgi:hypothetical protein